MKKIRIVLIILLGLLLCGCGNSNEKTSDGKFNENMANEISNIKISDTDIFEGLDLLNDDTLESILGINRNFVSDYVVAMSRLSYDRLYAVIKPIKGQEDAIKTAMNIYIDDAKENYKEYEAGKDGTNYKKLYENALISEYKGYYIVIVSDDNEKVLKKIKKIIK